MNKKSLLTPKEFLANYPPPLQELANALRALVRATLPDAVESVNAGWGLLAYRVPNGKTTVYVGYIGVDGDHAHLGFEYGILLPDPKGLLEGEGSQVRYLTIRRTRDIRTKEFAVLIRAAAEMAKNKDKRALLKLEQAARGLRT
jgi:hypothetical protein